MVVTCFTFHAVFCRCRERWGPAVTGGLQQQPGACSQHAHGGWRGLICWAQQHGVCAFKFVIMWQICMSLQIKNKWKLVWWIWEKLFGKSITLKNGEPIGFINDVWSIVLFQQFNHVCFSDAVRAPIPQTQEMLVEEAPAYGNSSHCFLRLY